MARYGRTIEIECPGCEEMIEVEVGFQPDQLGAGPIDYIEVQGGAHYDECRCGYIFNDEERGKFADQAMEDERQEYIERFGYGI